MLNRAAQIAFYEQARGTSPHRADHLCGFRARVRRVCGVLEKTVKYAVANAQVRDVSGRFDAERLSVKVHVLEQDAPKRQLSCRTLPLHCYAAEGNAC